MRLGIETQGGLARGSTRASENDRTYAFLD